MKKVLTAAIMLCVFAGIAGAYEPKDTFDADLAARVEEALQESIETLKQNTNALSANSPEFVKIENLAKTLEKYWPGVKKSITEQDYSNQSHIFRHFYPTMALYIRLENMVKNFKAKKDAPAADKASANAYLKRLAKIIDEPFAVKWSDELFIISRFIDREKDIFSQPDRDQLIAFADLLRQYKK